MTSFLLVISLILHFITFLILILLIKKMRHSLDDHELAKQKREIEDLLAAYALELKEDNEHFLKQISQKSEPIIQKEEMPKAQSSETNESQIDAPKLPNSEEIEAYEPSMEAKVLKLAEEGYNVSEIAKKLNKGNGEIELLLKFHR